MRTRGGGQETISSEVWEWAPPHARLKTKSNTKKNSNDNSGHSLSVSISSGYSGAPQWPTTAALSGEPLLCFTRETGANQHEWRIPVLPSPEHSPLPLAAPSPSFSCYSARTARLQGRLVLLQAVPGAGLRTPSQDPVLWAVRALSSITRDHS